MIKNSSYLPPLLINKIKDDDINYIKSIYDNTNKHFNRNHHFIEDSTLTFYAMKYSAKQCLDYLFNEHPQKGYNYHSIFKSNLKDEHFPALYYGVNILHNIHKEDNNYPILLGEENYNHVLLKCVEKNNIKSFKILLSQLPKKTDIHSSLLTKAIKLKSTACLKHYVDNVLIKFSNEEIFNIFINQKHSDNSVIDMLCWITKQSTYKNNENYSINEKDKKYNDDIFDILSPIIERFRQKNPEYLTVIKAVSISSNNILVFDKLKDDEYSYQSIIGENSLDYNLVRKLYFKISSTYGDKRLKQFYKTKYYNTNLTSKSDLEKCNFLYIYFANELSVMHYLYQFVNNSRKDELGNTSFHVYANNCREHLMDIRSLKLLENLLNENPEVFFEYNNEGISPADMLIKYSEENKYFNKNKVKEFIEKLAIIKNHFNLDKNLSQPDKKTKTFKV